MSTTALDVMYQAMRTANVLASGETPTTDESTDMLVVFQQLLDAWSDEEVNMFATRTAVITLAASTVSYAIPGARPAKILSADLVSGGFNIPVQVLGPDAWAALPGKSDTSTMTKAVYCDYAYTTPALLVAPIPAGTATLNLYCTVALPALAATTGTVFAAPEGLLRAVRYNLAYDYCIEFERPIPAGLEKRAAETKSAWKTLNASNRAGKSELTVPPVVG